MMIEIIFENENFSEELVLPNDETATIEKLLAEHDPQKTIPGYSMPPVMPALLTATFQGYS